ncbi:unnamed protein product, partial [Mesorhabditis belari]|uniref:Uncharacterized protein n=1 Tax=Mesorhabditis belari TaxID=2138241 RepID=A0AAF3FQH1_9BILA
MQIDLFLLHISFFVSVKAIGCYRCVSREESLSPIARTQIRNQIDTFFVPVEARSPGCSSSIDEDTPNVELQLCSVYPFCVTLTPNLPESSEASNPYVVRGCFELTLRSHLRESLIAEQNGCFLVRSFPGVPPNATLDYIRYTLMQRESQSPASLFTTVPFNM